VNVYAAGGYYYAHKAIASLVDEMRGYLDLGYLTLKMKVGRATLEDDLRRVEAVLALLPGAESLAVDANGVLDVPTAARYAAAFERLGVRWFEEPVDPLDFAGYARLAELTSLPIATGENLFARQEVVNLLGYAGLRPDRDVLQMDPALAYGVLEYVGMLDVAVTNGWSRARCIPHGGHQLALAIAAGLGLDTIESYPAVFSPIGGFGDDTTVESGYVRASQLPGLGIEAKRDLYRLGRELVADAA
jgi:L-alanine-DL-glutamate epimerase-like enolase superfamily enzyme